MPFLSPNSTRSSWKGGGLKNMIFGWMWRIKSLFTTWRQGWTEKRSFKLLQSALWLKRPWTLHIRSIEQRDQAIEKMVGAQIMNTRTYDMDWRANPNKWIGHQWDGKALADTPVFLSESILLSQELQDLCVTQKRFQGLHDESARVGQDYLFFLLLWIEFNIFPALIVSVCHYWRL